MSSYARKAVHGALIVLVLSLVSAVAAYAFRFLLARKLSIEEYGLFFALLAFISLLNLFKDFGLGYALLKFIPEAQVTRNYARIKSMIASCFAVQSASSGIITLALIIFAPLIMNKFFHSTLTSLFFVFALAFFVSFAQNIIMVCFQGFQKMFLFSIQDLARNLTVMIIAWLLLNIGLGIFAPAIAYLAMYAVVFALFFWIFTKKVFKKFWKVRAQYSRELFGQLIFFGLPAMLTIFGNNLLQYTDTLLLTYFTDLASVGLYQVAVPLSALVLYLAHAASVVATPITSELLMLKKKKELKNGIEILHKYLFLAVVPIAAVLIAFPEIFITNLFGNKFLGATTALRILAAGAVFYTLAYSNLSILFGLGKPKYNTLVMLATAGVNIILDIILIPKYGIIGAASATTTSYLLLLAFSSRGIKRVVKIKEPWITWLKTLASAVLLVAVLSGLKTMLNLNPFIELALSIITGGLAYSAVLLITKVITIQEIYWLKNQLLRRTT
jgi:O-antigen/teichoic acid export membrane protein